MIVTKHGRSHVPLPRGRHSRWSVAAFASALAASLPFFDDRPQASTAGASKRELQARYIKKPFGCDRTGTVSKHTATRRNRSKRFLLEQFISRRATYRSRNLERGS
jgi:hypothetical protein